MSEPRQVQVNYTGRVQGVGFRFTVLDLARKQGVTGYVQNLPDGSVRLLAQGPEETLDAFLLAIRSSHLGRHIFGADVSWQDPSPVYTSFDVKY